MTYALSHAQGGPQTEYVVNFNSLIAETTQVPGTCRQNLGLCESQAEPRQASQCSFYAHVDGWKQ